MIGNILFYFDEGRHAPPSQGYAVEAIDKSRVLRGMLSEAPKATHAMGIKIYRKGDKEESRGNPFRLSL